YSFTSFQFLYTITTVDCFFNKPYVSCVFYVIYITRCLAPTFDSSVTVHLSHLKYNVHLNILTQRAHNLKKSFYLVTFADTDHREICDSYGRMFRLRHRRSETHCHLEFQCNSVDSYQYYFSLVLSTRILARSFESHRAFCHSENMHAVNIP